MKALAPEEDWAWLRGLINRLRRRVKPVRNKQALVVSSYLILSFGWVSYQPDLVVRRQSRTLPVDPA
jgi:hypothetical protein